MKLLGYLLTLSLFAGVAGYCNGMGHMGYGPRTSKAFPPGWNGLSKTPFRGWRSWYAYYTSMNQDMIESVIDALSSRNRTVKGWEGRVSLCDLGYCAAGIDEGWEGCGGGVNGTQHYANGTPATNFKTFPDMKGLVEYGHSKGLEMGWYFNGCGCIEKREPASGWDINYEGDVRLLAKYGFDGVKFDGCGRMCNMTFYAELMQQTGKAYEIENCHWGDCTIDDASSCPTKDWCPFNWYRTSGDSNNGLGTWYGNLQTTIRFQSWSEPVSQPGCWAYPDMLQIGRLGCSSHTQGCPVAPSLVGWTKTHFAAFCIVSSPLVLSIHPSDENLDDLLDIIGNKMAMEINQAWAGHPGGLVRNLPPTTPPCPECKLPGTAVVGLPCDATDATQKGWAFDAVQKKITHSGLCLSAQAWGVPLNLFSCGNASTYQNYTYDANSKHFMTAAPANDPKKAYPALLEMVAGDGPQKVYVYRAGTGNNFEWEVSGDTIRNPTTNQCLAARGQYMPPTGGVAGIQIWAKPLGNGRTAALFINGGGANYTADMTLKELNITATDAASVKVTDVWTGEDTSPVSADGVWSTGNVPSMDNRFVVFSTK